jgi:hypothetical protein
LKARINFGRGPSKDHSTKVWSKLAQWFLRRRLKCEKFTTDDDDERNLTAIWPGELKRFMELMPKKAVHRLA